MIEGRVFVPKDIFVQLCVEVRKMSDQMLAACQALAEEVTQSGGGNSAIQPLTRANIQLGLIEGILKAIIEDDLPPAPTGPEGESNHAI